MIRAGWLDRGPGPDARRGAEPFVPVSWTTANDLLAGELRRVYDRYGGESVYGGSYGWSSAGRFHHAQSQLHDGQRLVYPEIRLVYWCGGNPFHHHQQLARLRQALARPQTIVVHDSFWTPMARHADVVLPASMPLERNDIGGSPNDACLIAMRQAVPPWGEARSDFAIFADLAARLGVAPRFTEGRDEMAWLRHLYDGWRARVAADGGSVPPFDDFWAAGFLEVPGVDDDLVLFRPSAADPRVRPADDGAPARSLTVRSRIKRTSVTPVQEISCCGFGATAVVKNP